MFRSSKFINKFLFVFNNANNDSNSSPMIDQYCYYDSTGVSDTNDQFEIEKGSCTINSTSKTNNGGTGTTNSLNGIDTKSTLKANYSQGRYQAEWNAAFQAIHALVATTISVIFIFGYLLIN